MRFAFISRNEQPPEVPADVEFYIESERGRFMLAAEGSNRDEEVEEAVRLIDMSTVELDDKQYRMATFLMHMVKSTYSTMEEAIGYWAKRGDEPKYRDPAFEVRSEAIGSLLQTGLRIDKWLGPKRRVQETVIPKQQEMFICWGVTMLVANLFGKKEVRAAGKLLRMPPTTLNPRALKDS